MNFIPGYCPPENSGISYWFLFNNDQIYVTLDNDKFAVPVLDRELIENNRVRYIHYLGGLDGYSCFTAEISEKNSIIEKFSPENIRKLFGRIDDKLFQISLTAYHILNWDKNSQYCGKCGSVTVNKKDERAKICSKCGHVIFPRISPAVIVAIINEDKILLARANRFSSNFYSVIAGFVEPGESMEDCVIREVKEETGIEVKNIRYFGSQPWPFPDSLMAGFIADYAGGEIRIDNKEILDAGWYKADQFPQIPERISIARSLIDWFVENQKKICER